MGLETAETEGDHVRPGELLGSCRSSEGTEAAPLARLFTLSEVLSSKGSLDHGFQASDWQALCSEQHKKKARWFPGCLGAQVPIV